jgi:hypothetical protein
LLVSQKLSSFNIEFDHISGYRGYGCTDSSHSDVSKYLPSVLLLTLSNLMFIPAIIMAIYYRLYIEALVYFFNMFFSTVSFSIRKTEFNGTFSYSFIMLVIKKLVDFVCLNMMDYNYQILLVHMHHL